MTESEMIDALIAILTQLEAIEDGPDPVGMVDYSRIETGLLTAIGGLASLLKPGFPNRPPFHLRHSIRLLLRHGTLTESAFSNLDTLKELEALEYIKRFHYAGGRLVYPTAKARAAELMEGT